MVDKSKDTSAKSERKPRGKGLGEWRDGTKDKVLAQVISYVDNPDEKMVPTSLAQRLAKCKDLDIEPSKLFADGGRGVAVAQELARKAQRSEPPRFVNDVYDSMENFMEWCAEVQAPPTIGAWALWNGATMDRMGQIERDTSNPDRAKAFGICKEVLRTFMEQAAWNNTLNPLLYFHAQKALYGIVEKTEVTVRVEDNSSDISEEEYRERVGMLTLEQGADGVYSLPD